MIETLAGLMQRAGIELPERRSGELAGAVPGSDLYNAFTLGAPTYTGRAINPNSALAYSAVYSSITQISNTVASLPLYTFRETAPNEQELATRDYRFRLLRFEPNRQMSSFQWRQFGVSQLLSWGNWYNYLDYDSKGNIRAIWPLRSDWVMVLRNSAGRLVYRYTPSYYYSSPVPPGEYEDWQICHVPGLGFDGVIGYSPITMMRQAVALGLAAEEFAGRFYANNARPNVLLTTTAGVKDPEQIRNEWQKTYGGLANAGKTVLLTGGQWDVKTFTIPQRDAQFLEGRNFQIAEIARIYNMPMNRLGDPNGKAATYASAEQADIDYAKHTIRPWCECIEQKFDMTILGSRDALICRHDMTELTRGDLAATATAYGTLRDKGIMTGNEIRGRLDLNPKPGADELLVQQQMIPLEKAGTALQPEPKGEAK